MTIDEFQAYASRHYWRNAVSYQAFCPHEYLVKNWFHGEEYRLFTEALWFVKRNGFRCFYATKPANIYLADGDYYYWSMDEDPTNDSVLNRARIDDYIFFEVISMIGEELHVRYRRRDEPVQPLGEVRELFRKYSVKEAVRNAASAAE